MGSEGGRWAVGSSSSGSGGVRCEVDPWASARSPLSGQRSTVRYTTRPSQEHGLVPIVEPEVTLGPGDYSISQAAHENERVLSHVFRCARACTADAPQMRYLPF